jgi:hypothetical protein
VKRNPCIVCDTLVESVAADPVCSPACEDAWNQRFVDRTPVPTNPGICEYCEEPFKRRNTRGRPQLYCTPACKQRAWERRRAQDVRSWSRVPAATVGLQALHRALARRAEELGPHGVHQPIG